MRILLHDYSGHPFQVQLARALAARGHEVRHLYSAAIQTPRGALQRRAGDPDGFQVEAIDPGRPLAKYSYVTRWRQERAYGRLLAARIASFRPDVVLMSNTPPHAMAAPQAVAHGVRAGFVFWIQDVYAEAIARILRQRFGALAAPIAGHYARLEGGLLRRSDRIVAITDDFRPLMRKWGVAEEAIETVENWAPLDELPPRPRDNPFAREHGLVGRTVVLYSGTLGLKHNPSLLSAAAEACRGDPRVQVLVVSEGLGADWLAARKAERGLDNLALLPFQPFERLPDLFGSADVLTAVLEPDAGVYSVPSKVLSYLCAGRALAAAMPAANLAARTIRRIGAGVVTAPDDEAGFVAATRTLVDEPARREAMGAAARAYAERTFDIGRIADRFEAILAGAMADAAKR